ncbi:MAG: F0F1 ATP synthase subunit B [Chloroflexi bacterium]|nr:F0F1 ATP synthase subunit B [Chloroflexota bacterium]
MEKLGFHLPSLIVYLVNFIILLGVLYFFGYKRILAMLDQRSNRIRESLEEAERVRQAAAKAQEEMQQRLEQSHREGQALLEQARQQAERYLAEERERIRQQMEASRQRALQEIQRERDAALEEVRRHFAELAVLAAERVIERTLDRDAHRELIEKVLAESTNLPKGRG